jgi:hypothetical protein
LASILQDSLAIHATLTKYRQLKKLQRRNAPPSETRSVIRGEDQETEESGANLETIFCGKAQLLQQIDRKWQVLTEIVDRRSPRKKSAESGNKNRGSRSPNLQGGTRELSKPVDGS